MTKEFGMAEEVAGSPEVGDGDSFVGIPWVKPMNYYIDWICQAQDAANARIN